MFWINISNAFKQADGDKNSRVDALKNLSQYIFFFISVMTNDNDFNFLFNVICYHTVLICDSKIK